MDRKRRQILNATLLAPVSLALPWLNVNASVRERNLSFYHTHTGEKLSLVYHDGLDYCLIPWKT